MAPATPEMYPMYFIYAMIFWISILLSTCVALTLGFFSDVSDSKEDKTLTADVLETEPIDHEDFTEEELDHIDPNSPVQEQLSKLRARCDSYSRLENYQEYDRELFETGVGSDATVKCQGREWKLHKTILASRCPVFRACFYSGFKEAQTGTVTLSDENVTACDSFLEFLYTNECKIVLRQTTDGAFTQESTPENVIALCQMADKYAMPNLLEKLAQFYISQATWLCNLVACADMLEIACALQDLHPSAHVLFLQEAVLRALLAKTPDGSPWEAKCREVFGGQARLVVRMIWALHPIRSWA